MITKLLALVRSLPLVFQLGPHFILEFGGGGLYLRLGKRDWFWWAD